MLKPAQLYAEQLKIKEIESWYDFQNMYYHGGPVRYEIELAKNTTNSHAFVSVDDSDNVIGYICYSIDWNAMSVGGFGLISFDKGNIKFIRDVYTVICDIFEKYHMNRLEWWCFIDNPAIRGYRRFIKKHGGRECAYYRQANKLLDGKLHDSVVFEIMSDEFKP